MKAGSQLESAFYFPEIFMLNDLSIAKNLH
jgi:hypothetical protein